MEQDARYHRYHVPIAPAPDRAGHPPRFRVEVSRLGLARLLVSELIHYKGDMRVVLSRPCVYGVFSGPVGGFAPRPERCVGCLRCTVQYPDFVRIEPNPDRLRLGDEFTSPDMVDAVLYEAASGRVPVRGAGYRGAFSGEGWDRMWTDMSEIVRPTRDGIHGREFISTAVDLGAKPRYLTEPAEGSPAWRTIPLPLLLDRMPRSVASPELYRTLLLAAERLDTLALVPWKFVPANAPKEHVVPLVDPEQAAAPAEAGFRSMVELEKWDPDAFSRLQASVAIPMVRVGFETDPLPLVERGVRVLHYCADYHGATPRGFVQSAMLEVHRALVAAGRREEVTLLLSGGISAAEHVPKAIISGADAVGLDIPVLLGLQAILKGSCRTAEQAMLSLPSTPEAWRVQRIVNLAGSWRDQLLEVLGAMGLREVRRLRGEVGRAMFADEIEREAFAGIAGFPG